jgi:UDP-3-O-acyl-N-acetylglucosamine deacetylase
MGPRLLHKSIISILVVTDGWELPIMNGTSMDKWIMIMDAMDNAII